MGLTRIRAEQISDIDYKQAVRVITLTDINLSGGAPAEVDGISLVAGNRVLVAGQDPGSENGLYVVQTVGAGSNGTWVRSTDGNQDGEIEAGMIVMVTEGTVYKDTQWKLITNNPIVIGTTPLVFEQNSAFAFGNIFANGTAVLANTVGDTVTFTAGDNIAITGNASAKSVTIAVTGISLNSISNGTSNVTVVSSGGNVTVGVAGSEIAEFSTNGLAVTGNITGNGAGLSGINVFSNVAISGGNSILADSISDTLTLVAGTGIVLLGNSISDTITIATAGSGESIFSTGGQMGLITEAVIDSEDLALITDAVTESYDLGEIVTSGVIYPDLLFIGDIADLFILGGTNGQYLGTSGNGVMQWQTLDSAPLTGNLAGNIQGNGFSILNLASLSSTGNVTGGNIITSGVIDATGNVTGGNIITSGVIDATGNVTGGNIITSGVIDATGNITGDYIFGNGSQLTGIDATSIQSGTSNVRVQSSGGNVSVGVGGSAIVRFTTNGIVNDMGNGVGNIGNATGQFNTIFAKATSAQYADLAECYTADANYPPGTVVVFGGDQEVTISQNRGDAKVAGVVSTNPSFIMNSGLEANHVVTVALVGRVPTKVNGPVCKGDMIISDVGGHGRACAQPEFGTVIGKSLENFNGDYGIIEIVVGLR
jgi:hypothetical protein